MKLKLTQIISEDLDEKQVVIRKNERTTLELNGSRCKVENITKSLDNMQIEVVKLTLESGCDIGVDPPHPGEEFLLCLMGTVEFQIGENLYKLRKADAIHFKPNQNTNLFNRSSRKAQVLWAYTPPRLLMRGEKLRK